MADRVAVYPGTFDPVTNGHIDILQRSLAVFDRVVVVIATNINKNAMFTIDERQALIKEALGKNSDRVQTDTLDGLLVDYCRSKNIKTIIRGLRALADFEYEFQIAVMNRRLAPNVDTMFFMTGEENFFVSSSLVKEVAKFGGDISTLVPNCVANALQTKKDS